MGQPELVRSCLASLCSETVALSSVVLTGERGRKEEERKRERKEGGREKERERGRERERKEK